MHRQRPIRLVGVSGLVALPEVTLLSHDGSTDSSVVAVGIGLVSTSEPAATAGVGRLAGGETTSLNVTAALALARRVSELREGSEGQ